MTAIQIVLVGFALFAMSRVVLRFRRGGLPLAYLVLWSLFWLAVIVVVLLPDTAGAVAALLGVGRGADVVIYLALVLLFYLLFRMFARLEELERQITLVVRAAALKELDQRTSDASGPSAPRSPESPKS